MLPRYEYSFFGTPDSLGGRFSLSTGAFNVIRSDGTNTRRAALTMDYERPFTGLLGDQWKITLHGDAAAYDASDFNEHAEFLHRSTTSTRPGPCRRWRWISTGRSRATAEPGAPS